MAILYIKDKNGRRIPIPAIKGENGHQMFVRFSAYADGTDMSETWDDMRDYMGIAFAVDVAPADKAAYQWICMAQLPNGMTMDENSNLHVKGEITCGEDNFSPREAVENMEIRMNETDAEQNGRIKATEDDAKENMQNCVYIVNAEGGGLFSNAYTATESRVTVKLGRLIIVIPSASSTGAVTLNLNGEGDIPVKALDTGSSEGYMDFPDTWRTFKGGVPLLLVRKYADAIGEFWCTVEPLRVKTAAYAEAANIEGGYAVEAGHAETANSATNADHAATADSATKASLASALEGNAGVGYTGDDIDSLYSRVSELEKKVSALEGEN